MAEILIGLCIASGISVASAGLITKRQTPSILALANRVDEVINLAQEKSGMSPTRMTLSADGQWNAADPALLTFTSASPSESLRFQEGDQIHAQAGIDTGGSWSRIALDGGQALGSLPPCNQEPFRSALANPLFKERGGLPIGITSSTRRFDSGFSITLVGLKKGEPYPGAPILVLVGTENTVYRFLKPEGSNAWQRIRRPLS